MNVLEDKWKTQTQRCETRTLNTYRECTEIAIKGIEKSQQGRPVKEGSAGKKKKKKKEMMLD